MLTVYYSGKEEAKLKVVKEILAIKEFIKFVGAVDKGTETVYKFKLNGNIITLTVTEHFFTPNTYKLRIDDMSLPVSSDKAASLVSYLKRMADFCLRERNKYADLHAAMDAVNDSDFIICR